MKNTRAKGNRLEFQTQKWMKDQSINFNRSGMSGQLKGIRGDFVWIENGKEFKGEAKSGKQVPKWLYKILEKDECEFLVVKRDRKKRLWIISDELLKELI